MLIKQQISVIDFVTENYGLPALFDFMQSNPSILNIEDTLSVGQNIVPVTVSPPFFSNNITSYQNAAIKILSTISVIDYCSENFGIESLFSFMQSNPSILNIEDNLSVGQNIVPVTVSPPSVFQNNKVAFVPAIEYEGQYIQSLWDISLQQTGSIENIFNLLEANPGLNTITNTNIAGLIYNFALQNNSITNFYSTNGIELATNLFVATKNITNRSHNISFSISFN